MKIKNHIKLATGTVLATSFAIAPLSANAAEKLEFKVSGQVSRAMTFADNGAETDTLFVDNNNSGTRLRVTGKMDINPGLTAGIAWETQYQDNSSGSLDIGDSDSSSAFISRKRELWFKGGWGKLSLGQGDGAANNTSESDLSGTWIANNSGDFLHTGFSFADGAGNKVIGMGKAFSNFDGLSRNDRLRYDTPKYGPLGLAVSTGQDKSELGLFLGQKLSGGSKVKAALGYVNNEASDFTQLGLSASYLTAGGFNVTGALGERYRDGAVDPDSLYIKVGQKMGPHNLSVGYHKVNDLALAGDEAERVNVQWVYNIAKGVELFADYQNASLDRASGPSLGDIDTIAIGSRIKF